MPQCFPARLPAALKRNRPIIVIAGAMVNGVMNRKTNPITPNLDNIFNLNYLYTKESKGHLKERGKYDCSLNFSHSELPNFSFILVRHISQNFFSWTFPFG